MLGAGCANRPAAPSSVALFDDGLFEPADEAIDPSQVFAVSPAMQAQAQAMRLPQQTQRDQRLVLLSALYGKGSLRLAYDARSTRNATEAFEARAGNCLSLAIMTAAFARELGLEVRFQRVQVDPSHALESGLLFSSGHVNLVLGRMPALLERGRSTSDNLIVDFLPAAELRGQRSVPIESQTVLAMYFNNRAAERLAAGQVSQSYWWARAALEQDPDFAGAANTLGVIFSRRDAPRQAEAALRHALLLDPNHAESLSNLSRLLLAEGRNGEAAALDSRLARLEPQAPFHFYELGRRALASGDARAARDWFQRELRAQPWQDDVHYWAAQADWALGDGESAADHLRLAAESSGDARSRARYIAKLESLRGIRRQ